MQNFTSNIFSATSQVLSLKGIQYQPQQLKDELLGHPDYPSLFAVHYVLNQYGLGNNPMEATGEHLDDLGQPFLAYMQLPGIGNDFATVKSVQNGSITYFNSKGKPETITREDFLSKWKNVAVALDSTNSATLAASNDDVTGTKNKKHNFLQLNIKTLTVIGVLFLLFFGALNAASPFIFAPWALLKMGGLVIAVLLLMYEADRQNETVKQFCTAGKTVNCEAVLQSKGASIGSFSWSEMGFTYFAGTFLYLLMAGNISNAYLPLAVLSILALPYTIYSVYYQYRIVKQWCKLCLAIQAIILVEGVFALWAIVIPSNLQAIKLEQALLLLPLLVLPLLIWRALKPSFKMAANHDGYKYAYLRLQNDPEVFNAMLKRQAVAPAGYEACSIEIGNPEAKYEILKVCNPYCGPCANAHPLLEALVHKYDAKLRIIFLAGATGKLALASKHFIALDIYNGTPMAAEAMHWWYSSNQKKQELLEAAYETNKANMPVVAEQLAAMQAWCNAADITHTPTIYLNGHRLPNTYQIADLEKIFGNE